MTVELFNIAHQCHQRNVERLLVKKKKKKPPTVELSVLAHWFHLRKVEHCSHAGVSVYQTLTKKHTEC